MEEHIGARIERLRKEQGMTHADLAAAAGVTASAISQIISGRTQNPRPLTLLYIARKLGISVEALIEPRGHTASEPVAPYGTILSQGATLLAQWFDGLSGPEQYRVVATLMAHGPPMPPDKVAEILQSITRKPLQASEH